MPDWASKLGDLVVSLAANGIESLTASAARRAEFKIEREAKWAEYVSFWDGFEARADDRIRDGMSDADAKPNRPDAPNPTLISTEEPTKS